MKEKKVLPPRTAVHVYCTNNQYARLKELTQQTTARSIAAYVRGVLFQKEVALKTRNVSMDEFLEVAIQLKNELRVISKSYDLAVKKLLPLNQTEELLQWVLIHEHLQKEMLQKTKDISLKMEQIYQLCLQK